MALIKPPASASPSISESVSLNDREMKVNRFAKWPIGYSMIIPVSHGQTVNDCTYDPGDERITTPQDQPIDDKRGRAVAQNCQARRARLCLLDNGCYGRVAAVQMGIGSAGRTALALAAHTLVLIAILAGLVMQAQTGEWFPPENSLSQYANGPGRWAFVAALLALGMSTIAVAGLVPRPRRVERVLLAVAGAGFVLAALIPAPAVGDEAPISDAVHQAGAITGTFGLSIGGMLLAWHYRHSLPGRCLLAAAAIGAVALLLLTLANFDIDLIGLGRRESWALHQSVSLTCMVLVVLLLPTALSPTPPGARRVHRRVRG